MRLQVGVDPCGFCGMYACIFQLTKKGNSSTIACSCKVPAVIPVQRRLEKFLADLVAWAADVGDTKIYWPNGMAGTGKTTIAYTF